MCHWPYIIHRGHGRTLSDGIVKCPHVICCEFTQDVLVTISLIAGVGGRRVLLTAVPLLCLAQSRYPANIC